MVLFEVGMFIFFLLILLKSSDYFVEAATKIARYFYIPEFTIGVTVIAVGTSLPEITSAIFAALNNESSLVIGTAIGSNIANISLILGIAALWSVIKIKREVFIRDCVFLIFVTVAFYILSLDGLISWTEGIMFVLLFAVYFYIMYITRLESDISERYVKFLGYLYRIKDIDGVKNIKELKERAVNHEEKNFVKLRGNMTRSECFLYLLFMILSCGVLLWSAKYLVKYSIELASLLEVNVGFVGLIFVAVGTSLPELAVTISSLKKGFHNMLIGNIIGSNITNTLIVVGFAAIINPIVITKIDLFFLFPFLLITTVFLLSFIRSEWFTRIKEGLIMLSFYAVFLITSYFVFFNN